MEFLRTDYGSFALRGFDSYVKEIIPRGQCLAVACHRGMRRSASAMRVLFGAGVAVANDVETVPTINYADFLNFRFKSEEDGLSVPGKTSMSFNNILFFHDGSEEETKELKRVREILKVEGRGLLNKCVLAEVRD